MEAIIILVPCKTETTANTVVIYYKMQYNNVLAIPSLIPRATRGI